MYTLNSKGIFDLYSTTYSITNIDLLKNLFHIPKEKQLKAYYLSVTIPIQMTFLNMYLSHYT